jgi:protease-4
VFKRFPRIPRLPFRLLNPLRGLSGLFFSLGNWRRRRYRKLDYVLLRLPDALPMFSEGRGWLRQRFLGASPLSLWTLEQHFERIANDPRPKGVILRVSGLQMSLADLQTLRGLIARLRSRGKRVVAYAQGYDMATYYVASACSDVILQPGGELAAVGLRTQAVFLKDALDTVGVRLDVVAISPYKGALDQFSRSDISPEGRQQLDWLLDSRFAILLDGIASGRNLSPEAVRALVDNAPYLDRDALAAGYVDAVINEEGLPAYLNTEAERLVPWSKAERVLLKQRRLSADKSVAILRVEGLMVPGESASPPGGFPLPLPFIGGARAGDQTVVRQVRGLMRDKSAAAVVLYIDSGGGAAIAAEAMTAALEELAQDRPLVVYMNGVAASGGYYIATPAHRIIAQAGTITGSIGVVTAKPVTTGVFERLRFNSLELTRGRNAAFYSPSQPFSEAQRVQVRRSVEHIYRQFIERVARGRRLSPEAVDAVGGGRVWTGAQAKTHGLVDELGDVWAALAAARALAKLPDDAPATLVEGRGKPLPPQLAQAQNPTAALGYAWDGLRALGDARAQVILPLTLQD